MKKILILAIVSMVAYFAWAQSPTILKPSSKAATPTEERLLSGAYGIVDAFHPAYNVTVVTGATHTLNDTNAIVFVRGEATVINHIIFPDCTNNRGRWFKIITAGDRSTAVLTNANSQSFEHMTNAVTTAGFSMVSNSVCEVISTGTNWFVIRSVKDR